MKNFLRFFLVYILAFIAFSVVLPEEVFAISNPNNISVLDSFVFPNAYESGDMIFFMRYRIGYSPVPVEMPEDAFQLALYDPTGAILLGNDTVFYYGENVATIRFTPAQVTALGLTSGTAYVFRVQGLSGIFSPYAEGLDRASDNLTAGDYMSATYIESTMISQATKLENDLNVDLIASGKLTTLGTQYFKTGFPELVSIAPNIFQVIKSEIDLTYRNWTTNYTTSLQAHRGPMLEGVVTGICVDLFHMSYNWGAVWLSVMAYLFLASFVYPVVKNAGWTLIIAFPVMPACAFLGIADAMMKTVVLVVMGIAFVFGLYFILTKFA